MPGIVGALDCVHGKGKYKVGMWTIVMTGTITVATGFQHIENSQVTVVDSSDEIGILNTTTASITTVAAPQISIVTTEHQGAANIVSLTEHSVDLLVIGYQHQEVQM